MLTNIFNIYFFPIIVLDIGDSKVGKTTVLLYKIVIIERINYLTIHFYNHLTFIMTMINKVATIIITVFLLV